MAAIVAGDIKFRLSVTSGSAGNTTAAGGVGTSLGKYISTTDLGTSNLFADVTGAQNASGSSYKDYQCVFLYNSHADHDAMNSVLYISTQVASGVDVTIGLDPAGATAVGASATQAAVTTLTAAPSGVTFTAPTSGSPLTIGTLTHGQCRAFWVCRTAANTAALNNDGATFEFDFDTAA